MGNNNKEKNDVKTGIVGENESFDNTPNKKLKELDNLRKKPDKEDIVRPCYLISRLPQACPISYGGETIIVPPRCGIGACYVDDGRKIGKLPRGIKKIVAQEKMKFVMKKKD